jgi:hypothetical protein
LLEKSVEYNLEPIEGGYEKVNKMKYLEDRNEGDRNFIHHYLILNYQTHFDTGKGGKSYVFVSLYEIKLA